MHENFLTEESCWSLGSVKVNTQGCCSCRPRRIARRMKRSGSTLLSSAKPRRSGGSEGAGAGGAELMPDSPLAVARSVCRARGPLTQRQAQHIWSQRILCCLVVGRLAASYRWRHSWQHAIESHAATDGGFVSGGRRSRVLSHSHSGTPDIRPAVRCGRERRRKIVVATRAAERPFQRAQAIGRRGARPAFCSYPP